MVFDLAIIGGGINGTGIARDAALRGLSVAVFERDDWGAGTTGSSTRMIHGGLRYLLYDVPTTRVSSEDAGRIRRIARGRTPAGGRHPRRMTRPGPTVSMGKLLEA